MKKSIYIQKKYARFRILKEFMVSYGVLQFTFKGEESEFQNRKFWKHILRFIGSRLGLFNVKIFHHYLPQR